MLCYVHKEKGYTDLFRYLKIFPGIYNTNLSSYIKKAIGKVEDCSQRK